jgi:hypothetical protein
VTWPGCSSTGTGATACVSSAPAGDNVDNYNCVLASPGIPSVVNATYSCSAGELNGAGACANKVPSPTATATCSATTPCVCTENQQCASNQCVTWPGCSSTGTGNTSCVAAAPGGDNVDDYNCVLASPGIPTLVTTTYSCGVGETNGANPPTACLCTNDTQCASGHCGLVSSGGNNDNHLACGANCTGGSTGLDAANCAPLTSTTSAASYCNTTLNPQPEVGGGASPVCLCVRDSDCSTGKCGYISSGGNNDNHTGCGSTGNCSGGTTNLDAANCLIVDPVGSPIEACAKGGCDNASGACTAAGQSCYCTIDSQCPGGANGTAGGGHCVKTTGHNELSCGAGTTNCSGTGSADAFDCELAAPGVPAAATPATYSCPAETGGSGSCAKTSNSTVTTCTPTTPCWCNSNDQCNSGQCLTWAGCANPGGTGTGNTQCVASAGSNTTDDYHCVMVNPGIPSAPLATPVSSCTTGFCSATGSGDVCWCTSDAQCGAGLCIPWAQCATGACNGDASATADDFHCQDPNAIPPPACTVTTGYTCAIGTCNATNTACECTADGQCPSGQCVNIGQCASGACSGTSTSQADECVPANITNCTTNSDCGGAASTEQCSGAAGSPPGLGTCRCTAGVTNCGPGLTCTGGVCTGCTKASQCKDLAHPATCTGAAGAVNGNCCNEADPAVGDAAVTASCGLDVKYFPEACLQSAMSAQEEALEFMFFDLTSCVTPDVPATPTLGLKPETFTLDFTSACPSGTAAKWRQLNFTATFPNPDNNAAISISAQTGPEAEEGGAMDAGTLLPATPLPLVTGEETTGSYTVLLDTSSGLFTTASPPLVSQGWLRLTITLTPSSDGNYSPTLNSWNVLYDCPASE